MTWIGKIRFCLLLWMSITSHHLHLTEVRQSGYAYSVTIAIAVTHHRQHTFSLTFSTFPDFSLTTVKFPDFSRFSRLVAALSQQKPTNGVGDWGGAAPICQIFFHKIFGNRGIHVYSIWNVSYISSHTHLAVTLCFRFHSVLTVN